MKDIAPQHRKWFMVILFSPALLIGRELNNDLWFLLNGGRYILQHGFPVIEPFSLHQNFHYVMQQWLSSVLFWLTYSGLGSSGPLLLTALVLFLTLGILFKLAMLVSNDHFLLSMSVTLFSSIGLYPFMVTRPFIFSTLIFILEIYLLELYIARGKKIYLYFLPLLSIGLINLHAAIWPLFLILGLPYCLDALRFRVGPWTGQGYPLRAMALTFCIAILAALINPYGLEAMTYLFQSYGHEEINNSISEMKVLDLKTLTGMFFYGFIALSLLPYLIDRKSTTRLRYILLTGGLLVLAVSSLRSIMLFAALVPFQLAYYLRRHVPSGSLSQEDMKLHQTSSPLEPRPLLSKLSGGLPLKKPVIRGLIALLACLLLFEMFFLVTHPRAINERTRQLDAIIAAIPETMNTPKFGMPQPFSKDAVRLYTGYNEGAYLGFQGYKPYIDARADVFIIESNRQKDVMQEYIDLQAGRLHYRIFLDRYQFTHLILGRLDILRTYLAQDTDYRLVQTEGDFLLYVKNA